MPAKNVKRDFKDNQYIHIFNQGVEKRKIFLDEDDYKTFLNYLFIYLADPELVAKTYPKLRFNLKKGSLYPNVKLLSYCLLPNHFHLLIHQTKAGDTTKLMKQLTNAYTQYFNSKNRRIGPLMQGRYRATPINNEEDLVSLSQFIHQKPLKINFVLNALRNHPWSSYPAYIDLEDNQLIDKQTVLDLFFRTTHLNSYENFIESPAQLPLPIYLNLDI